MLLNEQAVALTETMVAAAARLRVAPWQRPDGGMTLDCGLQAAGGLEAGRRLAEVCLAGRGEVTLVPAGHDFSLAPAVQVRTDDPVAACMASQYAGWQLKGEKFFGMGSGPMRAAAGREAIFERIGHTERPPQVVGVIEGRKLPPADVVAEIASRCHVAPRDVTLLIAPTASQSGNVQVVARSVETALHKLDELGFDLRQVVSGYGVAPLPPVAADDLVGIGRTNDAILYGAAVTLWVRVLPQTDNAGETISGDDQIAALGPKIPSSASRDYGAPFGDIFAKAGHDFYKIDPHLFSPAMVTFVNLATGRQQSFGRLAPEIVLDSFQR